MKRMTVQQALSFSINGTLDTMFAEERRQDIVALFDYYADMRQEDLDYVRSTAIWGEHEAVSEVNPHDDERDGVEFATDCMQEEDRTCPVWFAMYQECWERTDGQVFTDHVMG